MAKLKTITTVLGILLYATSCIDPQPIACTYYFSNESGVNVYIPEFGYSGAVNIANGEVYIDKGSDDLGIYTPFRDMETIDIIFNGDKIITYDWRLNIDDPQNILNVDHYTKVKVGEYVYEFYYTFTVEQYESAEPYEP